MQVFGPLLKLSLVGDSSTEIWHDLTKAKIYPLGYCQMNKIDLEAPESVRKATPEWESLALEYLEDIKIDTISMHFIDGDGITPVERIKDKAMLEVILEKTNRSEILDFTTNLISRSATLSSPTSSGRPR